MTAVEDFYRKRFIYQLTREGRPPRRRLRIAGGLRRRVPWLPWRYTAADYRAAVLRCAQPPLSPLVSTPTETPWEPALATAVAELGVRVEGESELELLLSDLT